MFCFKTCTKMNSGKESDVWYKDDLVCILNPTSTRGVLVYSSYSDKVNLRQDGLKTGELLYQEGISTGRIIHHPYIFFRAPYYSDHDLLNPCKDTSSVSEEIIRLYGNMSLSRTAWIRVDPEQTYVFSSEIRHAYRPCYKIPFHSTDYHRAVQHELNKSKKTLASYMDIISMNRQYICQHMDDYTTKYWFHLYSSEVQEFPKTYNIRYPFNKYDVSRNSEILVRLPHLPIEFFAYYE